jgi:ketosteroid isomerase-like protein
MTTATEKDILRHEERLIQAKRGLDLEALETIYADDLLLSGVMGEPTCGKAAVLEEARRGTAERAQALSSGQPMTMSADNQDMKIIAHGDAAVTNYRFVVTIKGPGVDIQRRYRQTNVWLKRDGRWQIVAGHMALVLEPKQVAALSGEAL